MKQKVFYSLALFIVLLSKCALAQTDSTAPAKPQAKISLNYNSNLNYFGRTDSLQSSGIFPMAELWVTPSFYINAAPIFVNNAIQSFDYAGTVATIGYQHLTEKWLSNTYFLKPFYEKSSGLVQAALKAQAGTSISRLTPVVNVTLGGDVKLSDEMDFGATAGLDHIIRIEAGNNSIVVLDPSFYAYAGTQRFSRTYTQRKSGGLLRPPTQQTVTESVNTFNILAYEASLPVIFAKGSVQVIATPAYVIPQNLLQVAGRPDLSETGKNTFYTTLGFKYTF